MTDSAQHLLHSIQNSVPLAQQANVKGTDLQRMREYNWLLILNYVREHGPIARAAIARATGLSATTVSTVVDALLQEDYVHEGATQRAASSGRRVVPVHFNAARGLLLGVALGRNYLTTLLCDLSSNIVARRVVPFDTGRGAEVCLPLLAESLRTFALDQGIVWNKIVGIGLGMPGPIDVHLQGPVAPPRMPGWRNFPVRSWLSESLGTLVYLENNANLGALGENRYGAGQGARDLLYVHLGAGIGGGLILDGKIYRGSAGSAGEIGHMTIDPQGARCSCGKRGCLEILAGAHAIVEKVHASMQRSGKEPAFTEIGQIIQAAQSGDVACKEALERAGTFIGLALANLMSALNPVLILLDGSSMQAGPLLLEPIRRSVAEYGLPELRATTQIMSGALKGDAVALGGVAMVLDSLFGVESPAHFFPAQQVAG